MKHIIYIYFYKTKLHSISHTSKKYLRLFFNVQIEYVVLVFFFLSVFFFIHVESEMCWFFKLYCFFSLSSSPSALHCVT